jgi:hypothetical protein
MPSRIAPANTLASHAGATLRNTTESNRVANALAGENCSLDRLHN